MTSKIVVNNIEADAGISTVFFNSDIGATDGTLNVDGNLTVDGVITYEDVTNVDSVGIVTAQSGIHVTSGQVLVAKTTTSITTQGSRVDNGLITVSGNSNSTNLATNGGGNLSLANIDSTDNNFSNIGAYNSNGLVVSQIDFINKSHSSRTGDIAFLTHNGSVMSERLRIDSSGRVLISDAATAGPMETFGSAVLQVATTAGGTLVLGRNDSSVSTDNGIGSIYFDVNDSSGNTWNETARITVNADGDHANNDYPSRMEFYTTGDSAATATERLRITSAGAIGIGSNFTAIETTGGGGITLDSGSGGGNIGLFIKSTGYTGNQTKLWQDSANAVSYLESTERPLWIKAGDGAGDYIRMDVAGSERLHIDSSGNLGVNKTPETDWNGSYRAIEIGNSSVSAYQGGTYPSIELNMNCRGTQASYGAGWKYILGMRATQIHMPYDGKVVFRRAASGSADGDISWSETMRITNDGKTSIGGITPQNLLNVNATGSMGLYGTIAGKVGHSIKFIRKYGSSATHTFATINGASPQGQSRLAGFVATYTFRSAYGFDSAGGGHGVRMLSGRVRDSGEWDFDTETDFGTGDSPRPTLQGVDNSNGTCNLQVVNPGSTHSYGEFHIVAWDCQITSPST